MRREKHIYFLRPVGALGPIKIGCSVAPTTRLRDFEIWSPHLLELVATAPGEHREEGILHQMFGDQRRHGEWFEYSEQLGDLVAYVQRTGKLPPLDYSLCSYAQKRADPAARSKMPRRSDPKRRKTKSALTKMIQTAERRAWGFHGHSAMRPDEIVEIMRNYQGFAAPMPTRAELKLIETYIERLNSLPAADRSMSKWDDWYAAVPKAAA